MTEIEKLTQTAAALFYEWFRQDPAVGFKVETNPLTLKGLVGKEGNDLVWMSFEVDAERLRNGEAEALAWEFATQLKNTRRAFDAGESSVE